MDATTLTVGDIARLTGVTVRALHHYDAIGLVTPSRRSDGGYRLYGRREIERLQEVLFFRELGMGLAEIRKAIDAPGYRREATLLRQRALLAERAGRLRALIDAADAALDAERRGIAMAPQDMLEVFGDCDPEAHREEAEQRWGSTQAYAESARRVAAYTKEDWTRLRAEAHAIDRRLLELMARGVPPDDGAAVELAEQHRRHISKWFYDCTPAIHAGLGEMYVADRRFRDSIDKAGAGLAEYLSAAIAANAARRGDASRS